MELTVVTKLGTDGKEVALDGLVRKHLSKKLDKLEHRWGKPLVARAVFEELPVGFEATVALQGAPDLVGRARGEALLKAVDDAVDKLTRQFEGLTDRRTGKARRRSSGNIKSPEF